MEMQLRFGDIMRSLAQTAGRHRFDHHRDGQWRRNRCRRKHRQREKRFWRRIGTRAYSISKYHRNRDIKPRCNCGRIGDLESLVLTAIEMNLLPYFLPRYAGHELAKAEPRQAAKLVRGLADKDDPLCKEIFRVQARALGLFFDEMVIVRPRCVDRRRWCTGDEQGVPTLVPRRNPGQHAYSKRGASRYSNLRDAEWRHREREVRLLQR